MTSWLPNYTSLFSLPSYGGAYPVGSCDVELPVDDLESPSPCPNSTIATVSFRIFYPSEPNSVHRPVKWVPSPQARYVAAYARFLGANSAVSELLSIFPQFLYMTRIPVHRNAALLPAPTESGRWPVVVFSHGLGGSRNAYSHICGSLASHGIVVIAADHRDSSAPISYIRATQKTEARAVGYLKLSHTPSPEVYQARDQQLKVRLWELGLLHDAIVKIDLGKCPENLDPNTIHKGKRTEIFNIFRGQLDLHRPGSIIWAGHSFGATTTVQFMKSVFYGPPPAEKGEMDEALFEASPSSNISQQITSSSVAILLDLWCLPLRSHATKWLWEKPMPCYDVSKSPAGGKAILAVLSEAFIKWDGNLNDTKRTLSPTEPAPSSDIKWSPYFFYPSTAAHISQSDFGIIFPWLTSTVLKTTEPERLLKLNVRAMLQAIRNNGFKIAETGKKVMEGEEVESEEAVHSGSEEDWRILDADGKVRGWNYVSIGQSGDKHVEEDYETPSKELDEGQVLGGLEGNKL